MEQSSLSILVDEKKVNDLLKKKTGAAAFLRSICNVLFFVFFLLLYTALALSDPIAAQRSFEGYLRRRFDTESAFPLDKVHSISSFWKYTNESFFPALYSNDTAKYYYPGRVIDTFLPLDDNNRLLGAGARIRTLKITPNYDCYTLDEFMNYFPNCYGPYDVSVVDKDSFGPMTETGQKMFAYIGRREGDTQYFGKVSTYEPGGFMEPLTADYNQTVYKFQYMRESDWLSAGTRVVMYDFTIYNFNLALYAVCSISFEVTTSGSWVKTFSIDMLRQIHLNPLGSGTSADWSMLIGECVLVICVMRYLLEEASEFLSCEKRANSRFRKPVIKFDYFSDTWNLLDWLNLLIIIVALGYRVQTWGTASSQTVHTGDPKDAGVLTFTDYSGVAANVRFVRSLTAFNLVLTWFKAVKYITIIPYITLFMQTVSVSEKNLSAFSVLFGCGLAGFVLAFSSAFGEQLSDFRSVFSSLTFLMRAFLGDANLDAVLTANNVVGSLLITIFVIGMVFVMMNIFRAIVVSALSDAKGAMGLKQAKEWQRTKEKAAEFAESMDNKFSLTLRFRTSVPGLYARIQSRKKKREQQELKRDAAELEKEAIMRAGGVSDAELVAQGPGRRLKRQQQSVTNDDNISEDEESEPDLGPLRTSDQLVEEGFDPEVDGGFGIPGAGKKVHYDEFGNEVTPELQPEAQKYVMDATEYVVNGITGHTRAVRNQLYDDMGESREVLQGIGNVLDVLSRRARSLEAQQIDLLKQY
eukprot:TRINITY_DN55459_c0_g1_i1.p1 TRINITY_DN55459_c0_g1~~TRINITY_DN55459_c0_g1_i1.p1  ORF type:complete len:751 (+),score=191.59 TRINITY_DN55459_c0_g1_i1:165-2417(+)